MSLNASVTVTPMLIDRHWMSDGTNFYRLRVSVHRDRRYIKTSIRVKRNELYSDGRLKTAEKRRSLEDLVRKTEEIVSTIDCYSLPSMSVDDVINYIQNYSEGEDFKLDFLSFADVIICEKSGQSRKTYQSAVNSFKSFLERESIDISEITSTLMRSWEKWLRLKYGNSGRAVSAYPACIAFIHGQARLRYNNEETGVVKIRNPFQYYKPPRQKPAAHRAVDVKIIQKMLKLRGELSGREKLGVDAFLISFALMGMNAPDLYSCTMDKKDIVHYYRTKTRGRRDDKAEMFVRMESCAKELFDEYLAKDGDVAFKFSSLYSSYTVFGENINEGLDQFCKRIKTEKITMYWARHSWASIAYENGVTKGVINDCLCHVDREMKVTDIYIKKDWSVLWKANEKVLKRFRWTS